MKRTSLAIALALLTAGSGTPSSALGQQAPAEEVAKQTDPSSPGEDGPAGPLLAFVDVETTGLVPGYHEMIDIGVVITETEGTVIDSLFFRIQPEHPERLSPGAEAVNAFDPERWQRLDALGKKAAVDSIVAFHRRVAGNRRIIMVANNSPFDAAFIDHLFRAVERREETPYHYRVMDLASMAWILGMRFRDDGYNDFASELGVPEETSVPIEHTGMTGARWNARFYRALVRRTENCRVSP